MLNLRIYFLSFMILFLLSACAFGSDSQFWSMEGEIEHHISVARSGIHGDYGVISAPLDYSINVPEFRDAAEKAADLAKHSSRWVILIQVEINSSFYEVGISFEQGKRGAWYSCNMVCLKGDAGSKPTQMNPERTDQIERIFSSFGDADQYDVSLSYMSHGTVSDIILSQDNKITRKTVYPSICTVNLPGISIPESEPRCHIVRLAYSLRGLIQDSN